MQNLIQKEENPRYLSEQIITYIGNKRTLLPFIGKALSQVQKKLNTTKLKTFDVFSGSGIVSRYLKQYSSLLITNDLEEYARIINCCYLSNSYNRDENLLKDFFNEISHLLVEEKLSPGLISNHYAPKNDETINKGERVFYTQRNAQYLDTARTLISKMPIQYQPFFLAPLFSEASIHANTSGVFKGFYKNKETGIGKFGGHKGDALSRITGDIILPYPVFSNFDCEVTICSGDSSKIAQTLPEVDLAYLDPPYNQHPYGSNYFMLNLLASYNLPEHISPVSGIPVNWNRSQYNKKNHAFAELDSLVENLKAKFLVVSFNSEGFISRIEMEKLLTRHGKLDVIEIPYNTFRGSRNLGNRNIHVTEYLYIVEKN